VINMARKPNPGSVAGIVRALAEEGHTDEATVMHAVTSAQPNARPAQIRKALAAEVVRASQERNSS
jgi:hypothetical protein